MRVALFIVMSLFLTACGSPKLTLEDNPEPTNPAFTASEKIYLSIDGGAMLGMIPLQLLVDIEKQTGKRIYQLVDGIIGTSTGAIIAALLTIPQSDGQPYSAAEALKFYEKAKNSIFSDANLTLLLTNRPQAQANMTAAMDQGLSAAFKSFELSAALIPLKIVSFEIAPNTIYIFDSVKAKSQPTVDLKVLNAVRASTAISPLFAKASFVFSNSTVLREFIDAGTVIIPANLRIVDPTSELFNDVKSSLAGSTATIYSLGTGYLDGPSDKTTAIMNDTQIKVVRIDPNIQSYLTILKQAFPALNERDVAAGAPMTGIDSIQAFKKAGEALKSSDGYQHMLKDMKAKAK